jgi:hypothetical protein
MLRGTKIVNGKDKYQRFMKETGVGFVVAVWKDVQEKKKTSKLDINVKAS